MISSQESEANKTRFGEPAKFLPVAFIVGNIGLLYSIYMVYHLIPLMQEPNTAPQATWHAILFNFVALMLMICYARCILTHPGMIPDKAGTESQSSWEYIPQDHQRIGESPSQDLQETKRSGDRRHCKWCAKYKPDRCHHCRVCRTCILKMDHHCPWIYNCVGFANHKYFFLVLFYSSIACNMIVWTMYVTLKEAVTPETPFLKMFLLLFGETLAGFLGFMVTLFFGFHIWLMLKAMTTIEFCEKSMKRTGYDVNAYNRGIYQNMITVLGEKPLLWLLPCSPPAGDGLCYITEEVPLLNSMSRNMEEGREIRKKVHESVTRKKRSGEAGTGECAGSDVSEDSCPETEPAKNL